MTGKYSQQCPELSVDDFDFGSIDFNAMGQDPFASTNANFNINDNVSMESLLGAFSGSFSLGDSAPAPSTRRPSGRNSVFDISYLASPRGTPQSRGSTPQGYVSPRSVVMPQLRHYSHNCPMLLEQCSNLSMNPVNPQMASMSPPMECFDSPGAALSANQQWNNPSLDLDFSDISFDNMPQQMTPMVPRDSVSSGRWTTSLGSSPEAQVRPLNSTSPMNRTVTRVNTSNEVNPHMPHLDRGKLQPGVIQRRTRKDKGADVNPEDFYGRPPPPPKSWGPKLDTGEGQFRYEYEGELKRGQYFSLPEMRMYLTGHPVRGYESKWVTREPRADEVTVYENGVSKSRAGLTLWIGWAPAQSGHRYPTRDSHKCRFADCAIKSHTIGSGDPQVIFDERMNEDGSMYDPYHNAGYIHLYCLEKYFDLMQLWEHLDVRLDTRAFQKEDQNWGSINYKHPSMTAVVHQWVDQQWPIYYQFKAERDSRRNMYRAKDQRVPSRPRSFDDFLTKRLVENHVANTPQGQIKQRNARKKGKEHAMDISMHLGNLDFVSSNRANRNASKGRGVADLQLNPYDMPSFGI